ncbi:tyrosinase family protein [Lysobacter sp. BMK333-48F3]|uniref:tyrosinase family protein n=1 Tax=Lysobacter sp. BMK333-48F3 TaxID=2867962 RepID=UPI001C8B5649|nr:tyrosinase family protein [Lysobacter sp. BMK333-48F3]MBX9402741.1 tyrosinase family protein [Lysobacter sp. BMK333-48F3]
MRYSRRDFLTTAATALGGTMLPFGSALASSSDLGAPPASARYRRVDVNTAEGQKMLASYARGVEAMLKLPADHPHNWFRNAFVHFLDCPHGNWWFYVWHRGYVGYFERTIRKYSGDPNFAMPFWDWTRHREIPAGMFDGVLSPTDGAYAPYTGNLKKFTDFCEQAMRKYWNSLSSAQLKQLAGRGYTSFDTMWAGVTGYDAEQKYGISGNMAFAITCGARYLSRANPHLDAKTSYDVSPFVINSGLSPTVYYDPVISRSFTSTKTESHLVMPDGATQFSTLEHYPHNKVHNCIGGVAAVDPGPYGNMTNFLSPVDPIFYLHHSNMDRLWDVWTRRQLAAGGPILPTGDDLQPFLQEPFLFYVDGDGNYVGPRKAGDYVSTAVFDYDYGPGYGSAEQSLASVRSTASAPAAPIRGSVQAGVSTATVPAALVRRHLEQARPAALFAEISLDRPDSAAREFDVLVNAPADVQQVDADSPYYAGTIAFFGPTMAGMSHASTFAVPLPKTLRAFTQLEGDSAQLNIRLVTSTSQRAEPVAVKALSIVPGD